MGLTVVIAASEGEVGPRAHEAIAFARELAGRMAAARSRGEIERLVLVAAPEFLGLLREALGGGTRRLVEAEFALNLVKMTPAAIRTRPPGKPYSSLAPREAARA